MIAAILRWFGYERTVDLSLWADADDDQLTEFGRAQKARALRERAMTEDKLHRAGRWKAFYEEEGGLRDVLDGMCHAYFERHASLKVNEHDKQYALSLANKVARELDAHIRSIVETGKLEAHRDHARRIEQLPAAKRRWI